MSSSLKAFLALVFVATMGAVLARPILNSVGVSSVAAQNEEAPSPHSPEPSRSAPPQPSATPEASPTTDGAPISGPFREQPLLDRYPRRCLLPRGPSEVATTIAVKTEPGRVGFGSTAGSGTPGSVIEVRRFRGFNASGALYAAEDPEDGVFISSTETASPKPEARALLGVVWSPTSECGLAVGDGGQLRVEPGDAMLLNNGVEDAAFSPDGRSLAVVLREGNTTSVWLADLSGTTMREVHRAETGPPASLEAWSPDSRTVYLRFGREGGLSSVTAGISEPPMSGGVVTARVTSLEQCGDRLVGIVNGAIASISPRGPDYLTETRAGYTAVTCAPNGSFLGALREDNLFLLTPDGVELRDLTSDSGFTDVYVDWGADGTGVLLGRVPSGGGGGQVWHIAEGGAARNTGLVFLPGRGAIDWAASPPTGLPLP